MRKEVITVYLSQSQRISLANLDKRKGKDGKNMDG